MATILDFQDLEVWKLARALCADIGVLIDQKKFQNNFGLINQIERSSGSIMDNIAEGFDRGTKAEFIQFLGYAMGSCSELRSQLFRALDRKYITSKDFEDLVSRAIRINKSRNQEPRQLCFSLTLFYAQRT